MGAREDLLGLYDLFPFHRHPLWVAIKEHELPLDGVLRAETQHYLRTKAGQALRHDALETVKVASKALYEALLDTYLEECVTDPTKQNVSHLELIERLVVGGGVTSEELKSAVPTVGNIAAIALYRHIGARGAGCHILGAGAVEYFYCTLCPDIYKAYTTYYGMSDHQAETYRIHGPMDKEHAERAFNVLEDVIELHGFKTVELSVRDAFAATSLHYDGMLQAATGRMEFWDGKAA